MSTFARRLRPLAIALALLASHAADSRACPRCKEGVASQNGESSGLRDGYSYSILLMMGAPFAMLGLGSFCVIRLARRGAFPPL